MLKPRPNPVRQQERQHRHQSNQQRDKQPQPTANPEQPLDVPPSIKMPVTSGTRQKTSTRLGPAGNYNYHQHHRPGQTSSKSTSHRQTKYRNFSLHSIDDGSLSEIIEYVSSNSLNRFRTCVVAVISKTPLDESVLDHLVQTILDSGDHLHGKPSKKQPGDDERFKITCQTDKEENNYETQVRGQADFNNGLVVLTLDSYMNMNTLLNLGDGMLERCTTEFRATTFDASTMDSKARVDENGQKPEDHDREFENLSKTNESPLLRSWPEWNQNFIKTLLILFTMSHVVVFYSPELSIDYSLIQTLKVLETLRIKSMNRISDLLEVVSSSQMFSQQWTRNCRISCPRALFLCDTSYIELNIENCSKLAQIRDELEEQIYMILKRSNLISGSNHNLASSLFYLPDKDDFVFVIDGKSLDSQRAEHTTLSSKGRGSDEKKLDSDGNREISQALSPNDVVTHSVDSKPSNHVINQQHARLRKFMGKHIASVRASAVTNQDHDSKQSSKLHCAVILPRFDDYFNIMLRLKALLFPSPPREERELMTDPVSKSTSGWLVRDERRFVDIYDLVDIDNLFSQRHCYKARLAAFELYARSLLAKPHDEALRHDALRYFSDQARGPAGAKNWGLLESEIHRHSIEIRKNATKIRPPVKFISRIALSDSDTAKCHSHSPIEKDKDNTLSITRRPNGVIVTASCECGRGSSLIIKPNDRKKKLERVDVYRIND